MTRHNEHFDEIHRYIETLPVFSDHEHHQADAFFAGEVTLDKLLNQSYVAWTGYPLDGSEAARRKLLENVRFNSYFTWFEKGLQKLHGLDGPLTMENWSDVSARIERTYAADKDYHWRVLLQNGYERLLQDAYWNPGDDCSHAQAFTPSFRIDKFMYGTHAESVAPNDFRTWQRYGFTGGSLDDYVEFMIRTIRSRVAAGAVALKCAEAYNRTVSFEPDDRAAATAAFGRPVATLSHQELVLFGNYIFNRACELAAELDIPFQVHTGLAMIATSQPMNFEPTIRRHAKTRFVMFHSGFPWTHQVAGLAHNYPNALPSLTWTATICTSAAIRALHDYIDVACSINTITWGSDCHVPEESVGTLLAWRWIVATVLAERLTDGRLTMDQAQCLARKFMYENGRKVYRCGG
jgi:predicted TIM-barrel fold metal-dependent hydrolase